VRELLFARITIEAAKNSRSLAKNRLGMTIL
jgi:hypothetical protein